MSPAPRVKGGAQKAEENRESREGGEQGGSSWKDGERREEERGQEELRASGAGLRSGFIIYRILIAGNRLPLETL